MIFNRLIFVSLSSGQLEAAVRRWPSGGAAYNLRARRGGSLHLQGILKGKILLHPQNIGRLCTMNLLG